MYPGIKGMELAGVTRSCDNKGTEILKPKDPNDPDAEGFVYDPKTKTVTLYAYDFCVFGFMMKEKKSPSSHGGCEIPTQPDPDALVYKFTLSLKTTKGVSVRKVVTRKSVCSVNSESSCHVYRARDTTKIEGWIYACEGDCSSIAEGSFIAWDSRRKVPIDAARLETSYIARIGKTANQIEWCWKFSGSADYGGARVQDYDLVGAGSGTFQAGKGFCTSASGKVVGRSLL